MCELFHRHWCHFSSLSTYQQQRRVDVDVLKHNELFLGFDGHHPGPVQLSFHPVPHAAVLPLEGSGQSPEERRRGGQACGWSVGYSVARRVLALLFQFNDRHATEWSFVEGMRCCAFRVKAAVKRPLGPSAPKVELALTASHMLSWFRLPAESMVRERAANKTPP